MKKVSVIGYEKYYDVDTSGNVFSLDRVVSHPRGGDKKLKGKRLTPTPNADGYMKVHLSKYGVKSKKSVHRLVADAFIPNPNNFSQVNHKNGDKTDNRVANLEWCTCKQNIRHSWRMGLSRVKSGHENHLSKLSRSQVVKIKLMLDGDEGESQKVIAGKFNVSQSTISNIKRGLRYCGSKNLNNGKG